MVGFARRLGAMAAIAVLATLATASSALATSVTDLDFSFCVPNDVGCGPTTSIHAGDEVGYEIDFTANSAVPAGQHMTIEAPNGTVFPAAEVYQLDNLDTNFGCGVADHTVTDDGATVDLAMPAACAADSGQKVSIKIGFFANRVISPVTAGTYTLSFHTAQDSDPVTSNDYTVTASNPVAMTVTGGDGQTTEVGTPFADEVTVRIADVYDNPVAGHLVTFGAPDAGATGTFSDDTPTTDSTGHASTTVTAGSVVGTWQGTAAYDPVNCCQGTFTLTNKAADRKAPKVKIKSGPSGKIHRRRAKFRFSSSASDLAKFECKLDNNPWKRCRSPKSYKVSRGRHKFRVRGVDQAGNTGASKKRTFRRV